MNTRGLMELIALSIGYDMAFSLTAHFSPCRDHGSRYYCHDGPLSTFFLGKPNDGRNVIRAIDMKLFDKVCKCVSLNSGRILLEKGPQFHMRPLVVSTLQRTSFFGDETHGPLLFFMVTAWPRHLLHSASGKSTPRAVFTFTQSISTSALTGAGDYSFSLRSV